MKIEEQYDLTHNFTMNFAIAQGTKCEVVIRSSSGMEYPIVTLEAKDGMITVKSLTIVGLCQRCFQVPDSPDSPAPIKENLHD